MDFKVECITEHTKGLSEDEVTSVAAGVYTAYKALVDNTPVYFILIEKEETCLKVPYEPATFQKYFVPFENNEVKHFARLENTNHTKLVDSMNNLFKAFDIVQILEPSEHIIDVVYTTRYGSWKDY